MVEIWRDLAPTTKLLFNAVPPVNTTADQKAWPAYRHVIMDVLQPPNFDVKYGVESHQYFTNYELDDYHGAALTRTPFRDPRTGEVSFVSQHTYRCDLGCILLKFKMAAISLLTGALAGRDVRPHRQRSRPRQVLLQLVRARPASADGACSADQHASCVARCGISSVPRAGA